MSAGGGAGGTRESPGCCPCVCGWRLGARSSSERRRVGSRVRFPTSLSPRNAPFCKPGITLPNSACLHEAQTERLMQKISRNRRGNIRERGINAVVAGKSHARASLSRGGRLLGADANRRRSPLCARGQTTRHQRPQASGSEDASHSPSVPCSLPVTPSRPSDRCSGIGTAYLALAGSLPTHLPAFLVAIATVNINDHSNTPRGAEHILKKKSLRAK